MSEWSHLANAKHIDLIIAHIKANPAAWDAVYDAAWDAVYDAAWDAVRSAALGAAFVAAWHAVWNARRELAYDAAWDAVRAAILALVAWDRAGGLMDLPAEQVKVLAILGDQAALLMYPAIAAIETTWELA